MRGTLVGPRVLLRRLREVMVERVGAQERLDKIVVQIAANMVAEVCSVYVLRADGTLELYATEGLNPSAVHHTSLRTGEGLVGLIAADAKPLNLANAQAHPSFAYRPETGEEIYNSFLGAPILRAGRTLGVVVVQNRAHRLYSEEELEALQTAAMLLAEMLASGELRALAPPGAPEPDAQRPVSFKGLALAEGIGLGHAVLHEPRIAVTNIIAEDTRAELTRLETALESLRSSIDDLLERGDVARGGEHRDVLEAYRMFAHDRGWAHRMREAVAQGLTAEAAVERVQSDTRARMLRQTDPYIRERLHDLDDLANRLLRILSGRKGVDPAEMPKDAIIVARSMGPAELLDYNRERLRGVVLEEGSANSHVSIVARALGLPLVGQAESATALVEQGDALIVDGLSGDVHVRPPAGMHDAYAEKVRFRARRQEQYRALKHVAPVTRDGHHIAMLMNAGLLVDLPHLAEAGAEGIGLFRTEFQFMVSATFPRMRAQRALYRQVLEAAGHRPVTFRSLDVGGDKVLPYLRIAGEENPALGWRAIRLALDRPGLLKSQVRALLHAAAGRDLNLMFPMIAEIGEFDRARAIVAGQVEFLARHGHEVPAHIRLGVMIEVPSILYELDALMARVDFVSVGSNDLIQFLFAADRGNQRMANRFDALSLPALRALRAVSRAASRAGVPFTLCGEIAGRPLEAMALIALGYRAISLSPAAFGPVKSMILALNAGEIEKRLLACLDDPDCAETPRQILEAFAAERGIPV